ncbi:hypothetical protein [Pseudomonas juntendi]|uniref:hypothetical protein n=1 Tax=Pseudomonas juntendi TaxID=2666183 RepID=UPI0032079BD8
MIAQVFVRHADAVKGSDSIASIGKAPTMQNALCKMHDHAACTMPLLKKTLKPLFLLEF